APLARLGAWTSIEALVQLFLHVARELGAVLELVERVDPAAEAGEVRAGPAVEAGGEAVVDGGAAVEVGLVVAVDVLEQRLDAGLLGGGRDPLGATGLHGRADGAGAVRGLGGDHGLVEVIDVRADPAAGRERDEGGQHG